MAKAKSKTGTTLRADKPKEAAPGAAEPQSPPFTATEGSPRGKGGAGGKLSLSVQYACNDEALPSRPKIRRWVKAALENSGDSEITVRIVDSAEGQELNRDYRGKDYATNVLSFPYSPAPQLAGDLVLCLPVVLSEAAAQGKSVEAHFAHLIVHGMLHLQGFDHEESEADAEIMEALEREILTGMSYPDPYAGE